MPVPPQQPADPQPSPGRPATQPSPPALPAGNRSADEESVARELAHLGMGALADRMGIELLELSAQRTVARMPVAGNTQPLGLLHGGASAVLAESTGSVAATLHAGPGRVALGLELGCTHHRAVRNGQVLATATPLALSRNVASYTIAITDDEGRSVCTARLTCLLRDR